MCPVKSQFPSLTMKLWQRRALERQCDKETMQMCTSKEQSKEACKSLPHLSEFQLEQVPFNAPIAAKWQWTLRLPWLPGGREYSAPRRQRRVDGRRATRLHSVGAIKVTVPAIEAVTILNSTLCITGRLSLKPSLLIAGNSLIAPCVRQTNNNRPFYSL